MPMTDPTCPEEDHMKRRSARQQDLSQRPGVRVTPRHALAVTCLAGALLAALPLSSASASKGSTETFAGSCSFSGTVTFDPALTGSTQSITQVADLVGTCTGTFTKADGRTRQLENEPAVYHATSTGQASCGEGMARGAGYLEIRNRKLRFSFSENRVAAASSITLDGEGGGSFDGVAHSNGDPVTITMKCNGAGLRRATVDLQGQTTSPISG